MAYLAMATERGRARYVNMESKVSCKEIIGLRFTYNPTFLPRYLLSKASHAGVEVGGTSGLGGQGDLSYLLVCRLTRSHAIE